MEDSLLSYLHDTLTVHKIILPLMFSGSNTESLKHVGCVSTTVAFSRASCGSKNHFTDGSVIGFIFQSVPLHSCLINLVLAFGRFELLRGHVRSFLGTDSIAKRSESMQPPGGVIHLHGNSRASITPRSDYSYVEDVTVTRVSACCGNLLN